MIKIEIEQIKKNRDRDAFYKPLKIVKTETQTG